MSSPQPQKRDISFKEMRDDDILECASLYADVYAQMDVHENWSIKSSEQLITFFYKTQPDMCFVAKDGDTIVALFISQIKPWWDGNHLVDGEICVNPKYQKEGIATRLSLKVYKAAIERYNIVQIDLVTFNREFPLSWYKKQGFEIEKNTVRIFADSKVVLKNLK